MTITEKFATLTTEQQEKFNALKDGAGLDAFLSDTGLELTEEEKAQVLEFIETGKLPIDDDELDAAAGGVDSSVISAWRRIAESEGRGAHIGCGDTGLFRTTWRNANCPKCDGPESLFGSSIVKHTVYGLVVEGSYFCTNVKCYVCGYIFGDCTLQAGTFEAFIKGWG